MKRYLVCNFACGIYFFFVLHLLWDCSRCCFFSSLLFVETSNGHIRIRSGHELMHVSLMRPSPGPQIWRWTYDVVKWPSATLPSSLYPSCCESPSYVLSLTWLLRQNENAFSPIGSWTSAEPEDFLRSAGCSPLTSRTLWIYCMFYKIAAVNTIHCAVTQRTGDSTTPHTHTLLQSAYPIHPLN